MTLPFGPGPGNLLVHPVDAPDHRRLAASGRADDRRHLVGREIDVDALDGVLVAVIRVEVLDRRWRARRLFAATRSPPRPRRRSGSLENPAMSRLWSLLGGVRRDHASRLLRETNRAIRLRRRISATRVSADPHARLTNCVGVLTEVAEDLRRQGVHRLAEIAGEDVGGADREQQRRGLAGAARDREQRAGDRGPAWRSGSTTLVTTRHRGAPSASAASRRLAGTSWSTTSAERVTIGSISSPSATAPFQPTASPPTWVTTSSVNTNRPNTIDGTPVITSTKYRTTFAYHDSLPYSVSHSATVIPTGTAISVARPTISSVPRSALRIAADVAGRRRRRAGDVREALAEVRVAREEAAFPGAESLAEQVVQDRGRAG